MFFHLVVYQYKSHEIKKTFHKYRTEKKEEKSEEKLEFRFIYYN